MVSKNDKTAKTAETEPEGNDSVDVEETTETEPEESGSVAPKDEKEFVVEYTGSSDVRRIDSHTWEENGITQETLEWNEGNDRRIPIESLSKDVLAFLTEKVGDFKVVEA